MSPRFKRFLLIVVLLFVLVGIGFAIWWFFFRPFFVPAVPTPPTPPTGQLPPTGGALPPTGIVTIPELPTPTTPVGGAVAQPPTQPIQFQATGGVTSFTILESHQVLKPTLSTNGTDVIYYDTQTGFFYRITPDGTKELYSDQALRGVSNVTWSPDNRRAILEYPDGSNTVYSFATKESVTLPSQWKDFTFSPDGAKIAFKDIKVDKENRYITVADINGQGVQKIERLGDASKDADVHVTWAPNNKYVALYRQSIDIDRGEVSFIGFNEENYRAVTVEGRDLRFEWSPSGRKMVYSVYNGRTNYNPMLWVTFTDPDLLGTGKNNLGLQTWADKCVFASENEIYCAVPRTLDKGSGIAPQLAAGTPDDFYKVNILTGQTQLLAQPLVRTTAEQLMVSTDGKQLYWVDQGTKQLNKMDL